MPGRPSFVESGRGTLSPPLQQSPQARSALTLSCPKRRLFILLGLSAIFPVLHAVQRYGLHAASAGIALPWLALGGALYIAGALFYAERFPERLFVGRCDRWGGSHTIFHVFILLAAWAHYAAIVEGFRYWHHEVPLLVGVCQ